MYYLLMIFKKILKNVFCILENSSDKKINASFLHYTDLKNQINVKTKNWLSKPCFFMKFNKYFDIILFCLMKFSFSKFAHFYHKNGYVVIPKVVSSSMCSNAIEQVERLKNISGFFKKKNKNDNGVMFRTHGKSTYFADSFNRVSYFFENTYSHDKQLDLQSMIKIGHGMHKNKLFQDITFGKTIQQIQLELGVAQPLVVQSMILQKLPRKGGKVTLHQDSTYLFTQPDTIKGYWIPLQNVTQQNGCIWVLPGSHRNKLYYRMKKVNDQLIYDFDGPINFKQEECIPIEMERGDLLILSGRLLHKSHDNLSNKSRYAYTWHTMNKSSQWADDNWMSFEQILKHQNKNQEYLYS